MSRLPYLDRAIAHSPLLLKRLIAQINPIRYDERLSEDRFTLREVVAHLADFEPVILARMQLAATQPGATVESWDEDKNSIEKDYKSIDMAISLESFISERTKTAAYLSSLPDDELQRTVRHPALGILSIYDLATFALSHDSYHLDQVTLYLPEFV